MTTQNGNLKIVISLAKPVVNTAKNNIENIISQLNIENKYSAKFDLVWCNEDSTNAQDDWSQYFCHETPILLLEEINKRHKPDIVICVFGKIFGSLSHNINETDAKQLAKDWLKSEHPTTKILFCDEVSQESTSEKRLFISNFKLEAYPYKIYTEIKKSKIAAQVYQILDPLLSVNHPKIDYKSSKLLTIKHPDNWLYLNEWLNENSNLINKELSDSEAENFFDGKIPSFADVTPITVPRRKVNKDLLDKISIAARANKFAVTLIHGAGGEGKSTILKQVAIDLLLASDPEIHIFYRDGDVKLSDLIDVLKDKKDKRFLIVSDNAGQIAKDISDLAKKESKPNNIQFLLAIRTTHWEEAIERILATRNDVIFNKKEIGRLNREDATEIIKVWGKTNSLGKLKETEVKDSEVKTLELRIQKLVDAAKLSIDGSRNSFLGAILWARKNQTLDERVRDILDGLESKISYNEKNLHYYFNYIIALHGDGFYFLTKEVLAKAIGCEVLTLNTQILEPLKDEAAILEEMKLVLARHDVFAERAKELLKEEVDFNKIIGELAVAAEKLFTNKSIGDIEIGKWNKLKEVGYGKVAQAITEALANDEELVKNPINTVFYANVLVENAKKAREKGDTNFFEKHINEAQKIYLTRLLAKSKLFEKQN